MRQTRRTILKSGGATLAALGLAGCSGGGDTGTDGGNADGGEAGSAEGTAAAEEETPTPTPPGTPTPRSSTDIAGFEQWLPEPAAVGSDHYTVHAVALNTTAGYDEDLGSVRTGANYPFPVEGIESLGDIEVLVDLGDDISVMETPFDRETVAESIAAEGISDQASRGHDRVGDHRGYTILTRGAKKAAAVGDGELVTANPGANPSRDARSLVEAVVDAKTGNVARLTDAVAGGGRVLDALGPAHVVRGRTHPRGATFDDALAEGTAMYYRPDRTTITSAIAFTEGGLDEETVRDRLDQSFYYFDEDEATASVADATFTTTTLFDSEEVNTLRPKFPGPKRRPVFVDTPPKMAFQAEYQETGDGRGVLRLQQRGDGEPQASQLFVRGSGFADVADADQTEPGPWQGDTEGVNPRVTWRNEVEVGVTSDYEIKLVWESEVTDASGTVFTTSGPDA